MDSFFSEALAFLTTLPALAERLMEQALAFINAQQAWAGPIAGLIIFLESLAIVGLAVPATALMVAVGGLIGAGSIDGPTVLAWSLAGAIVGDAVSYYAGRLLGPGVCHRWPLRNHRPAIARSRLFFRRYGTLTIFFGRFLGPIRSTVPLVAGVLMMSNRRFQFANVASALIWVPVMFAPGYLAAVGIADLGGFGTEQLLLMVAGALGASIVLFGVILRLLARRAGGGERRRRHRHHGRPVAQVADE